MKVNSTANPNNKGIGVELSDADMSDVEGWEGLPYAVKWRKMTDRADALLVEYMLRRGDISKEYADQRMREIVSGIVAGT